MRSSRAWLLVLIVVIFAIGISYFMLNKGGSSGSSGTDIAEVPVVQLSDVVVVKTDINPRTIITSDMIEIQQKPAEYIHPMALTKLEDAIGRITLLPLNAGEEVLSTKIANPDTDYLSYKLKEGYVAFTVPVSELTAAGGMVHVGDKVHVLGSYGQDVAGKNITKFTLYDVPIIAIGKEMAINYSAEAADSFTSMTLEVTPEDAAKLAWAQNNGTITFILKSVFDKEDAEEIVAIDAKTFFGNEREFQDMEYLKELSDIIQLRSAEEELKEYGYGDIQHIRERLNYQNFYYDNLNPGSDKGNGSSNKNDSDKSVEK